MDHSHVDHGHMDHGDMDMGGDQCSMNVRLLYLEDVEILTCSDAIYLVVKEPLHYLSSVARYRHLLAHPFAHRDRSPDRGIRVH
jgi:hypothetical protein